MRTRPLPDTSMTVGEFQEDALTWASDIQPEEINSQNQLLTSNSDIEFEEISSTNPFLSSNFPDSLSHCDFATACTFYATFNPCFHSTEQADENVPSTQPRNIMEKVENIHINERAIMEKEAEKIKYMPTTETSSLGRGLRTSTTVRTLCFFCGPLRFFLTTKKTEPGASQRRRRRRRRQLFKVLTVNHVSSPRRKDTLHHAHTVNLVIKAEKGITKNLCDKDLVELWGEVLARFASKPLFY